MKKIFFTLLITIFFYFNSNVFAGEEFRSCLDAIQPAINKKTGECKNFPTPCDVPSGWKKVDSCEIKQNNEDTQIIDYLEKKITDYLNKNKKEFNFHLHREKSCTDLETIFESYINNYYKNRDWDNYFYYTEDAIILKRVLENAPQNSSNKIMKSPRTQKEQASNYSKTNIQVLGVDEGDIIKNDGEFIYYYSYKDYNDGYVYIIKAFPSSKAKVVKKIKLPKNMKNVNLYIENDKLVILGDIYDYRYKSYGYINGTTKTYVIVYDIKDKEKLKLDRIEIVDGALVNSRKIGDYVYTITRNYINIPFYHFYEKKIDKIDLNIQDIIPNQISIVKDNKNPNLVINKKKFPYNIKAKKVANCSEIEYILPDEETLKEYDFSPSVNIISVIDIKNPNNKIKNSVIVGDIKEIHMSNYNLYLTNYFWTSKRYKCRYGIKGGCIFPFYDNENTLVHKFSINKDDINYKNSTIIPGRPLTQYSMDEFDGNFRIITKKYHPELSTNLYILDEKLELIGKLEDIEKGEEFKSSRYIGDKLYLVTFKEIDPLFVIDLKDIKNPKILGELKIPGYSTYLHPYDENHLIGLGYDTMTNKWGGVVNNGLKIDLYEINYDKKCGDNNLNKEEKEGCLKGDYKGIIVKQKFSKKFGGGTNTTSPVLYNPRAFVWDENRKLLFLPATLYTLEDENDVYSKKRVENVSLVLNIDKDIGIKEIKRVTNLDIKEVESWQLQECQRYYKNIEKEKAENNCVELKNGEYYCPPKKQIYIPKYCYKDASVYEYLLDNFYRFYDYKIERNIYMDDNLYTISKKIIKIFDMNNDFTEVNSIDLK